MDRFDRGDGSGREKGIFRSEAGEEEVRVGEEGGGVGVD